MARLCFRLVMFVILGVPSVAMGHPVVIHAGRLHWAADELRLEIQLDRHAVEHEIRGGQALEKTRRLARSLVQSLRVITHESRLIAASSIEINDEANRVTSRYDVPADVRAIAVQHRPGRRLAPIPRQFQIEVHSRDPKKAHRSLRLTTGGNHAVVLRDAPTDRQLSDRFDTPILKIGTHKHGQVLVRIEYPCRLLAMWPQLSVFGSESLTGERFRSARPAILNWAKTSLSAHGSGGGAATVHVVRAELVGPNGENLSGTVGKRYSIFTTRVRVTLSCHSPPEDSWLDMHWSGFRPALLSVAAYADQNGKDAAVGALTPTQNTLRWSVEHERAHIRSASSTK